MTKELELTGQTKKSIRQYYGLSAYQMRENLRPIQNELDELSTADSPRSHSYNVKQVARIKLHMEGK